MSPVHSNLIPDATKTIDDIDDIADLDQSFNNEVRRKMWVGIREFIGWLLVVIGLACVGAVVSLALQRNVLGAMALSLPATIVFRSGIGLVRMSAASRVATRLSQKKAS